jgi:hypothetical protein
MKNEKLKNRDLDVLWHPCTQMKDHETLPLIPIKKAYGVYLEDFEENTYIDAVSSWWVNIFGHTNKYINKAVKSQIDTLEHIILAGFTHEGIVKLSERLVKLTPPNLDKCFYADNGSSAVEVALKMSFHSHKNDGKMDKLRKINFVKYAALLKVLETLADVIEKAVQVKRNKKKLVDHLSVMELLALKFELEERIAARRRESKLKEEALASTELNEREEDVKEEKEEKKTLTLAAAHLKEEEERIKEKEQEIKSKQKSAFKAVEDLRQKPPREIKAPKPPRPY